MSTLDIESTYMESLFQIETYNTIEEVWTEPFPEFMYRYQSLQRHWPMSRALVTKSLKLGRRNFIDDGSAEAQDFYSETVESNLDYFPQYLRGSTISIALALIENLLNGLGEAVAKEL